MMNLSEENARRVHAHAVSLGFDCCGIARADPIDLEDRLGGWLDQGFHAGMDWIVRTKELRQRVDLKLPGAQSVIVVARNYYQPDPPHAEDAARIARYARGRDYHKVLRAPLKQLAAMVTTLAPEVRCDIGVDSAPYLERAWAARAGVGWIGRNSLVLNRQLGSWFLLGIVATTLELAPDVPVEGNCGTCRACLDACPTGAILEDAVVDSNRCIAYHTIENRGEIPAGIAGRMAPWIFGCDICQEVCPWNRFQSPSTEPGFAVRPDVAFPDPARLLSMDESSFLTAFAGTPVMRAKLSGMQRNARLLAPENPGE